MLQDKNFRVLREFFVARGFGICALKVSDAKGAKKRRERKAATR
jgi:hypothetical protein